MSREAAQVVALILGVIAVRILGLEPSIVIRVTVEQAGVETQTHP